MSIQRLYIFIHLILLPVCLTRAQVTMTGGKGMLRLYEAEPVTAGDIYLNPFASFYAKADYNEKILLKDNTMNIGVTLGISRMFETFIHLTPYQTDQVHLWGAVGDSKLGLKLNIPKPGLLQYALLAYADFPTGQTHPIPFEPYSEETFGYAMLGLCTLDFRRAEVPFPFKVSFNLGYKSHNSSYGFFSGDTDQILGGIGCKFPIKSSQLYTEVTGEIFINNPAVSFAQNSLRWSGGFKTLIKRGIIFDVATDIELGGYKPKDAERDQTPRFYENYADWKIIVGLTYRWTLFPSWDKNRQEQQKQQQKQQEESDEIKQQRQDVIKELQEYQKRLEEEEKENVPF